jgi:transposase
VVGVEQWAEIRRLYFVRGLSKREISRRTGLARDTVDRAVLSDEPPVYRRESAGSSRTTSSVRALIRGCPASVFGS